MTTNPKTLAKLAINDDSTVRLAAAENPATPSNYLARLADDEDVDIRKAVAANPATPEVALVGLAKDGDDDIRLAVAKHPTASAQVLSWILHDSVMAIRAAAAVHSNITPDQLAGLYDSHCDRYGSTNIAVAALVACNPILPAAELAKAAEHIDWNVRLAAAGNPSTPIDALEKLAEGQRGSIGRAARRNLNRYDAVA